MDEGKGSEEGIGGISVSNNERETETVGIPEVLCITEHNSKHEVV